jgi:long-chain acyl-CoA synthetase
MKANPEMPAMSQKENTAPQCGLVSGERYLSPTALRANAHKAASAMHHMGIWQGDVVALLLRNDFVYFEATQGAGLLGATTVPMNWHMTPEEIAYILDDCDAKLVIAHSDLLTEAVLSVCLGREVVAVETPREIVSAYRMTEDALKLPGALAEWYSWISAYPAWTEEPRAMSQPMFYTSGTTGMPKGVRRKGVSPDIAAKAIRRTSMAFGLNNGQPVKSIMTGPLYHSAPNAYGMKIVRDGGLIVLQPRFDALDLLNLIQRYQISHLHMVPTMFVRLLGLAEADRQNFHLDSLVHVAHGAAPCPAEVKRAMIEWWGPVIYEYYAMTETGIIAFCDSSQWLAHPGTVGTAPEGIDIIICDESGQTLPQGSAGEICIASETTPYVAYHRAEKKTSELRRGNYVATGDVGYLDEGNFLFISDRISDMVISGGVNIYPAEIEKVLVSMPGVKDCAVFGIPHSEFGEALVAVIEAGKNAEQVDGFLKEHIASYKIPRIMVFTENLPREDSGKIKKRLLRDAYLSGELS